MKRRTGKGQSIEQGAWGRFVPQQVAGRQWQVAGRAGRGFAMADASRSRSSRRARDDKAWTGKDKVLRRADKEQGTDGNGTDGAEWLEDDLGLGLGLGPGLVR